MELILISDSKLKIMMTANEMDEYDITDETFGYEMKDIRKVFSGILDEAKKKTGFDSSAGKLFIQIYPSKSGGCEVYVTKNNDGLGDTGVKQNRRTEYCVYCFEGIETVINVCKELYLREYDDESRLYTIKKGDSALYYLVLREELPLNNRYRKKRLVSKSDVAAEFGKRIGGREAESYIKEHGEAVITDEAVKYLGRI